uniref:Uncharacterized protein n=1 Tax=Myoviridae sp. ctLq07 TaxID=2827681 RepID=A0A8S5TB55_9CAUD|nr:MAG TPA: hypothetical protein [Myoviridae sp. ctLq07]
MPVYTPTPLLITVTPVFYSTRIFLSHLASTYSATSNIYINLLFFLLSFLLVSEIFLLYSIVRLLYFLVCQL